MKGIRHMQPLTPQDPETHSPDLIVDNIARLKALFPELVTEGPDGASVNVDVLKSLVGDQTVTDCDEKYSLNWHGKRQARQLALTPSTGTLRPCPEESVDWDTTQNIFIEGDNLEVLKLLQKSYAGKVKLIYIDPPYNTGKDFVYPDDLQDSIRNYLELTAQVEGDRRITSNTEASGRFHTRWLNMIYPRLRLARNLLGEEGVIFVTIDDSEASNLRLLMDSIFGAESFVSSVAWKKRSSPDARDTIGSVHDWILCYVKNTDRVKAAIGKIPLSEQRVQAYSNPDNDPRGDWASVDMTGMTGRATKDQFFLVELPSGRVVGPPEGRSWGLAERTFHELRADNRIWFGRDGDSVPRIKRFLSESDGQVVPSFWNMTDVGSNDEAKKEVNEQMGQPDVFDTPKPVRLVDRMIDIGTKSDKGDIVMDFFAGSGTTGQAVAARNAYDGGNRRYILVQLPEALDPRSRSQRAAADYCDRIGKPRNIAELTKERLRRAGDILRQEIEAETEGQPAHPDTDPAQLRLGVAVDSSLSPSKSDPRPSFTFADLGFRVFKLDHTNIRTWEPNPQQLDRMLLDSIDHIRPDRTEQDILYELLLKLGLDLCVSIETRTIAGKPVHAIGAGTLIACLDDNISRDQVEPLALGIVDWHHNLAPAGDTTCVFRDSAFADDVAKTNLAAILNQHGITNVRSL
jgi:adenine-specific DNA-methyltransferase